jgi:hypothetical protein
MKNKPGPHTVAPALAQIKLPFTPFSVFYIRCQGFLMGAGFWAIRISRSVVAVLIFPANIIH